MKVAGILLAAGASHRMGQPKQLMELDGEALVHSAARVALEAGLDPVIVVLGCQVDEVGAACAGLAVRLVVNEGWREGMASSLRVGINTVPQDATAALILACDQPAMNEPFLMAMLDAHRTEPGRIVAAAYAGSTGIPALFPRSHFESLKALSGDRGARALLREADVRSLPLPGGEMDIDTLLDFEQMRSRMGHS